MLIGQTRKEQKLHKTSCTSLSTSQRLRGPLFPDVNYIALEFRLFAIANECGLCKWLISYLFI